MQFSGWARGLCVCFFGEMYVRGFIGSCVFSVLRGFFMRGGDSNLSRWVLLILIGV